MRSLRHPSRPSFLFAAVAAIALAGCAATPADTTASAAAAAEEAATVETPDPPVQDAAPRPVSLGNGEANWIVVEGASRDGATLTFREVRIDGNGWLVLHPFKDGKPDGNVVVGHTYLESGTNEDVAIDVVDVEARTGDMFIVMLHRDVNENQQFDFVFVDERNVLDRAVFEGSTMIAHAIAAP